MATKKRSFDAAFKLSVGEDAEKTTNEGAARICHVDERRITRQIKTMIESFVHIISIVMIK